MLWLAGEGLTHQPYRRRREVLETLLLAGPRLGDHPVVARRRRGGLRRLITPHTANSWAMAEPMLAERVRENVGRFGRREPLVGVVDLDLAY